MKTKTVYLHEIKGLELSLDEESLIAGAINRSDKAMCPYIGPKAVYQCSVELVTECMKENWGLVHRQYLPLIQGILDKVQA